MLRRLGLLHALAAVAALAVLGGRPLETVQAQADKQATPRIAYKFGTEGQVGFTALDAQGNRKNLTFADDGETNSTVLLIDGKEVEFGAADGGQWAVRQALGKGKNPKMRHGHKSVWIYDNIAITQIVQIVPSKSGQLDACVVSYIIDNKDNKPRKIGLRDMIDTMIDENDGNAFAVPGKNAVITTRADFKDKDVPAVVQALEQDTLQNPGLVANFSLKVGGGHEAPDRFSITTLPEDPDKWDVPVEDINGDAAVAIYWNPRELRAGGQRTLGFAYGQGTVSLDPPTKKK